MSENILSVSSLTSKIKQTLEDSFEQITVEGEISNFKPHYSGHWYFTLKDDKAQISCTMWKGMNSYVFFTPEDGMKIIVRGKLSVYPPRGSYQIDVRSMKPAGQGELQAAFEKLKMRLSDEGLFDQEYKKEIPRFPEKIGIVTASDGAAFKDLISVAQRRYPLVELIIKPTRVQGEGAAKDISNSIEEFNTFGDVDIIIVGRGGGSLEDLWAFNEEIVARAIFNSNIPIISAVGHEIDFTISDFVADLRAPTPSAAMELATPDFIEIKNFIENVDSDLYRLLENKINSSKDIVNNIFSKYAFKVPENILYINRQTLDNLNYKMETQFDKLVKESKNQLVLFDKILDSFDVNKTLKRGFSLIRQNNEIVKNASVFNQNKSFSIQFVDKKVNINR
jgi:exodeoxyribonuclease VII large subunit